MKRFVLFMVLAAVLILPVVASGAVAGSCIRTPEKVIDGYYKIILACTGDSGDGSIPTQYVTTSTEILGAGAIFLYQVKTYPTKGGTAPDAADVAIYQEGMDLLGGKGVNLIHATSAQDTVPYSLFMTAYRYPPITSNVTLTVANQATVSANYTIEMIFLK
jgi:hypothetical protein